jgi:uncharacterized membrane protein
MQIMIIGLLACLVSALFCYVESFRSGLSAKHWGLAGLLFGPLVLPLFNAKRRMALRRVRCFSCVYLRA